MLRTRGSRTVLSALVLAASASLVAPTPTMAAPQPASAQPGVPAIAENVPSETLAALAPTIVGAISAPAPIADSGQAAILAQARLLLATPGIPAQVKSTLERVITFLDGSGGGGPDLPPADGPRIAQFLYPTIGKGCIGPTSDSIGTALAVPGPAELPPPGPASGQTGFVFTALGTEAPTVEQDPPLTVQWLNLDNRRTGVQPLTAEAAINPDGPATLSAIADTGTGRVAAVISGSLTTTDADGEARTCSFAPTLGFFTVA
ncbi:Rv1157c family protein [Nocardia mangyaensis]|uniref:Rv1157c family protein n=1 Tax=Nocardia mangyaensis TaxID=2213200 RepID=UPI003F5854FF